MRYPRILVNSYDTANNYMKYTRWIYREMTKSHFFADDKPLQRKISIAVISPIVAAMTYKESRHKKRPKY